METLKFLLRGKKADIDTPREVVTNAVKWMRIQFENAGIEYHYADGGAGFGVFGHFEIQSRIKETLITLHLKIAEINSLAYAFAQVCVRDRQETILFPFFGEISSEDGKLTILHYIADFILSTSPEKE